MKYLIIAFLCVLSIYPFSFAKYNWDKKNKIGAVGAVLLGVASIVYPTVILLTR